MKQSRDGSNQLHKSTQVIHIETRASSSLAAQCREWNLCQQVGKKKKTFSVFSLPEFPDGQIDLPVA